MKKLPDIVGIALIVLTYAIRQEAVLFAFGVTILFLYSAGQGLRRR